MGVFLFVFFNFYTRKKTGLCSLKYTNADKRTSHIQPTQFPSYFSQSQSKYFGSQITCFFPSFRWLGPCFAAPRWPLGNGTSAECRRHPVPAGLCTAVVTATGQPSSRVPASASSSGWEWVHVCQLPQIMCMFIYVLVLMMFASFKCCSVDMCRPL